MGVLLARKSQLFIAFTRALLRAHCMKLAEHKDCRKALTVCSGLNFSLFLWIDLCFSKTMVLKFTVLPIFSDCFLFLLLRQKVYWAPANGFISKIANWLIVTGRWPWTSFSLERRLTLTLKWPRCFLSWHITVLEVAKSIVIKNWESYLSISFVLVGIWLKHEFTGRKNSWNNIFSTLFCGKFTLLLKFLSIINGFRNKWKNAETVFPLTATTQAH